MRKKQPETGIVDAMRAEVTRYPGTRYKLAKVAGISMIQLTRFLSGERDLRLETADKLARAMGLALVKVAEPITEEPDA